MARFRVQPAQSPAGGARCRFCFATSGRIVLSRLHSRLLAFGVGAAVYYIVLGSARFCTVSISAGRKSEREPQERGESAQLRFAYSLPSLKVPSQTLLPYLFPLWFHTNKSRADRGEKVRKEGAHVCGANCAVSQSETCARGRTLGRGETGAKRSFVTTSRSLWFFPSHLRPCAQQKNMLGKRVKNQEQLYTMALIQNPTGESGTGIGRFT